ncbi:MAG: CRISPR-associated ring nuclease [Burkholderiales bacterium]
MNLLLCTLGASWAVVPEIVGFLAPAVVDLYRHHPRADELAAVRARHGLLPPDEIWIVTTEGDKTVNSLERLDEWCNELAAPLPLRVWTARGTDQLASQAECSQVRELTLRLALLASERAGRDGQLVLSLAGGRKTMAADLQWAGSLFGAHAWLHVVGPDPIPSALVADPPARLFTAPLTPDLASAVIPLVVGRGTRDELLDIDIDGHVVGSSRFPVPMAESRTRWALADGEPSLITEIESRQQLGSRLLGNFLSRLAAEDVYENWRSLYRLSPQRIELLRNTMVDASQISWLDRLPKADLHRHLGGALGIAEQRAVGQALWVALSRAERDAAMKAVGTLVHGTGLWEDDWPARLRAANRPACSAALLAHASDAVLEANLYGTTEPRIGLKAGHRLGFAAYERPGELSGSALLCHPAAVEPYASALVDQARREGLVYVELRGSPQKYRPADPVGFCRDLRTALERAGADDVRGPCFRFVWILDRRDRTSMASVVALAAESRQDLGEFLVGLDLAGDEGTAAPEALGTAFVPAFRECLAVTIHAGEGEAADHIWQAAYHLHADRIGHGLTLRDNPRLMQRFRDRGICLELCPTSNREVVGFHDPAVPESAGLRTYPMREFIARGLPVAVCTDNPGISRTTLSQEFVVAARMSGGMSAWESLALIRNGFAHAFADAKCRDALLKRADELVFARLAADEPASLRSGYIVSRSD